MARKKKHEEHENHERWLVSYADFITLLFAFFVVMYSISSVNEGKYRVLSDSISSAFDPSRDGLPIKLSSPLRPPIVERDVLTQRSDPVNIENQYPEPRRGVQASPEDQANFERITDELSKSLAPLIKDDQISVTNNELWVEVEIKSSILFSSGKAALSPLATPVLRRVSATLKGVNNQIQVEGFTDNVPIETVEFPSNWELSAARAASVVHLFTNEGLKPSRLSAVGYGEYKPIADNDTPEGRQKNRRISIIVLSDAIARTTSRTEQLEQSLAEKRKAEAQQNKVDEQQQQSGPGPIILLPQARQLGEAVR